MIIMLDNKDTDSHLLINIKHSYTEHKKGHSNFRIKNLTLSTTHLSMCSIFTSPVSFLLLFLYLFTNAII